MRKEAYQYFSVKVQQMTARLEFETLTDMCRFTDVNQIDNIFILHEDNPLDDSFAIYHNACLLLHKTEGYKTLENFVSAGEKGYPNAIVYYDSIEMGYTKYEDYLLVKEAGISDLATFEIMKKKGFITGLTTYKELEQKEPKLFELKEPINNPFELYSYANQHNFDNCSKLLEALAKGFEDANLYSAAKELGFPTHNDFIDAGKRGFRVYGDLKVANELGIRDGQDFTRYNDLEIVKQGEITHDQRVLLIVLSKIEQGKKISLNKLNAILENNIEEYKYEDTKQLPRWFSKSMYSLPQLSDFLQKSVSVKRYGNYHADGEFFEINKMQDRSIVLDASNVAHNSNGRTDKKVYAQNLVYMIDFLKEKGFQDIIVIADASLRHKVEDNQVLERVKKMCTYLESPRETTADVFILQYVKRNHCLMVSNDNFREWKMQDPWAAENVDFYRLSFIIKGKEVLMPDLK
jgi:hypothetical protein